MANVKFTDLPNLANVTDTTIVPVVAGNVNYTVTGANLKNYTSNVATISATGNITGNYFIGNGSQLTGIVSSYGNANVVTLLAGFGSNALSTTGNVTAGYVFGNGSQLTGVVTNYSNANVSSFLAAFGSNSISTTGNVTAANFVGSGAALTAITGANVTGTVANATFATSAASATTATTATSANTASTVTSNAQANITSVGTLTSLSVTGNVDGGNIRTAGVVSATGNITGQFFIGNGSQLTGLAATYSNANVASFMAAFGSNTIVTTGNITAGNFIGNGSRLTSLTGANVTGTVANATFATSAATATSAITAGTVTTAAQGNITSVGTLTSLSVSGNIQGGNLRTAGLISATGNVTAAFFIGNGSLLTNISAANVSGNVANATYATSAGTATTATTANTASNVSITDDTANVNTHYPTMVIATAGSNPIKTSSTKLTFVPSTGVLSVNGTVSAGNITSTTISATGNITSGNLLTGGSITATGAITSSANITGGNIITSARSQAANYTEGVFAIGSVTGTLTPNISLGAIQSATLVGNITLNAITNIQTGQSFTLILTQDATGGRTLSSTWKFAANSKTLSTAANSTDIISVFYDGTTYWAVLSKGFA